MPINIHPLRDRDILDLRTWSYPPPYDMYSMEYIPIDEALEFFKDPENGYFGLSDGLDSLIGFCNYGYDAQVQGGDYSEDAVDIGIGIRPELTGHGSGSRYAAFVFGEARRRFPGKPLRVTIAAFNQRAQRVCEVHGFIQTERITRPSDGKEFVVMRAQPWPESLVPKRSS